MTFDPDAQLTGMLAHLNRLTLGRTLVSGAESCDGVLDDEDTIQTDGAGGAVQVTETVVRLREGAITRPAIGATVTTRKGTDDALAWVVREVRKDAQWVDLWRITLARA